jgi:hypothetical protein
MMTAAFINSGLGGFGGKVKVVWYWDAASLQLRASSQRMMPYQFQRKAFMITRRTALGALPAMALTALTPDLALAGGSLPAWDNLLAKYVRADSSGLNRVNYAGWKANSADMAALDGVVSTFAAMPVSTLSRGDQFCLWANLYNALTVQVVLSRFPVRSIRDIKSNPLALGPWKDKRITVQGARLSLDDIEHNILRKQWRDPRVHYAVNCASIGCPNLGRRGWRAESLDADLNAAARAFINSPRGVRVAREGQIRVSSIYQWFKVDFGNNDAGVLAHLRQYATPALGAQLANARIVGNDYDWAINAASGG